jgi:hypothetical protein
MTLAVNIAQSGSSNVTFRNRIINGSQLISQRYGATLQSNLNNYVTDRWAVYNGISTVSMGQTTTAPTGYTNSLYVTTTTAGSMPAANSYMIAQCIEANNVTDFGYGTANAATATLSFWVRSSLTGTFAISINNGATALSPAATRSYVTTYTINSANTWEQKTVTITGDQSGTWNTSGSGIGITVDFDLGSGTNYATATTNTWQTGNYLRSSSSTNFNLTTGATFYITGVQLEAGTTASPFEYRQYGTELALCQRYCIAYQAGQGYQRFTVGGGNTSTTQNRSNLSFPVEMRTSPSLVTTGTASNYAVTYAADNITACTVVPVISTDSTSPKIVSIVSIIASGLTLGNFGSLTSNANSSTYLIFTAEL